MSADLKILEDHILKDIGLELMFSNPQKQRLAEGVSAIELSRKLGLKTDVVKKKLKILQEKDIIHSNGMKPKLWQFDEYNFKRMDETDPVYTLLCNFDDVDFSKFFEY